MIRKIWPVLAAGCVLIAAAAAHGLRTDRWGASPDLAAAAARLDSLPLKVGDWDGVSVDLPPEQVKAARAAGIIARRYTNRYTQAEVTVLILCGRPGPISIHTPDVCYQGAGFVMGPNRAEPLADGHTAWVADFKKVGPQPVTLRIRWAWCTGQSWVASGSPRMEFARAPVLYKMYVVRSVPAGDKSDKQPDNELELSFVNEFLPALQTALSPL